MNKKGCIADLILFLIFLTVCIGLVVAATHQEPKEASILKKPVVKAEAAPIVLAEDERVYIDKIVLACLNGFASQHNIYRIDDSDVEGYYEIAYKIIKARRRLK